MGILKHDDGAMRTSAPPKMWGGQKFFTYRVGVGRYQRRNEDDTVHVMMVKGSYRCMFREPHMSTFAFVMNKSGKSPQKFVSNEKAALAGLAAVAAYDAQPRKYRAPDPEPPQQRLDRPTPFNVADKIALLIDDERPTWRVSRGQTTTGSAMLALVVDGWEYNVVVTRNRYQKRKPD